jgi:S-adenosylmethionine synthetase
MPDSPTNPLQLYGRTKRDGEIAVLGGEGNSVLAAGNRKVVLRVPVL